MQNNKVIYIRAVTNNIQKLNQTHYVRHSELCVYLMQDFFVVFTDKDVARTDRLHVFYSEANHSSVKKLYDILLTYCMYNFDLGKYNDYHTHSYISRQSSIFFSPKHLLLPVQYRCSKRKERGNEKGFTHVSLLKFCITNKSCTPQQNNPSGNYSSVMPFQGHLNHQTGLYSGSNLKNAKNCH